MIHDGQARMDSTTRTRADAHPEADSTAPISAIASAHPVLELQRLAGNRAVSAGLDGAGSMSRALAGIDERSPAPAGPVVTPIVSDDQAAELEADHVADATIDSLGNTADRAPAVHHGVLSPVLRAALASVAPDVSRRASPSVHTDESAGRATDAIGARAFSSGNSISVDPRELADHRESNRLLAHEATHVARHGAGSDRLVHAKLRGTRQAMESQGGGPTSGKLRKFVGKLTNWDQIIAAVGAYESLESALLQGGNPSPEMLDSLRPLMLSHLQKAEAAALAWQSANGGARARGQVERERQRFLDTRDDWKSEDPRVKAERRQAVVMLLPRLRLEMEDLKSDRWIAGFGLSDEKVSGKGREDQGQINKVQELHYVTESGEFSGYFKEDKGTAPKLTGHEARVGIGPIDPNYGARSVAMYRIDQLLGANVTAKAEFAVHDGKLGTVTETAKGKQAVDVNFALNSEQQKQQPGTVSVDDPVLQRAMNKLQILDALCGQLDRHQGNWVIDVNEETGKVNGVTGIDLDMAFGSEMQGIETDEGGGSENYLGMPSIVDQEFGNRLLEISEMDIRNTLKGLLAESEINATISRFTKVQSKVRELKDQGKLTATWDGAVALDNRVKTPTIRAGHKTYGSQMSGNAITALLDQIKTAVGSALGGEGGVPPFREELIARMSETPKITRDAIVNVLQYEVGSQGVRTSIWAGTLPPEKAILTAMEVLNEVLGDETLMAKVEVAVQETGDSAYQAVNPILSPAVRAIFERRLSAFGPRVEVNA